MAAPQLRKRWIAATVLAVAALPLAAFSARAGSGAEIGDARTIVSIVKADFDKEERELTIGDVVRQDEVIEVSNDGKGEFRLNDDTKLALGPGARMVLDKFVYDSDKKTGTIVLDLTKGAFRFITGVAAKPTYLIRTPNASITVRGTIFDTYILPDNSAWLLLHEGAIEVTAAKNVCHVLDRPGQLIRVTSDGTVGTPVNWRDMPDRDATSFDTAFPFVSNTPQIEPVPATTRDAIEQASLPDAEPKVCLNLGKPKTQKADDNDDKPKKKKKRQASKDDNDFRRRPRSCAEASRSMRSKTTTTAAAARVPWTSSSAVAAGWVASAAVVAAAGAAATVALAATAKTRTTTAAVVGGPYFFSSSSLARPSSTVFSGSHSLSSRPGSTTSSRTVSSSTSSEPGTDCPSARTMKFMRLSTQACCSSFKRPACGIPSSPDFKRRKASARPSACGIDTTSGADMLYL